MADLLSTVGGYEQQVGLPGAPATSSVADLPTDTYINMATTGGLDGAGMIEFGVVVAKHAAGDRAACPLAAANLVPVGISRRQPNLAATPGTNLTGYKTGSEFGVFRLGDVVCLAAEAVVKNDQVVALVTPVTVSTGNITNVGGGSAGVANGTTRIAVPRHVWKTTTASGQLGIVGIHGLDIAPTLTS